MYRLVKSHIKIYVYVCILPSVCLPPFPFTPSACLCLFMHVCVCVFILYVNSACR